MSLTLRREAACPVAIRCCRSATRAWNWLPAPPKAPAISFGGRWLLKVWKVAEDGSYVDGMHISNVTLDQLRLEQARFISVRIGVKENARHVGGINIFGRSFGNYPQDIVLRLRFRPDGHEK